MSEKLATAPRGKVSLFGVLRSESIRFFSLNSTRILILLAIVLYAAVFPSIASQVLWVRGVEMIGPNRAGLFINAIPVFGTLLSVVLINETFHLFHLAALLLVLGGIAIAEWGRPKT